MVSWWLCALVGWAGPEPGSAVDDLSLGDLLDLFQDQMDTPTSVADRAARSQRESSALVTVLTGDELRRLGARDLLDALQLIPGLSLGIEMWNVDVIVSRGIGGEGRVLLLIDGHEMNDMIYGANPWSHRIPATLIDRVEVIRGPGSTMYGGFAMLTVIRVTTRASTAEGFRADARVSALPTGVTGRRDLSLSAGGDLGDRARIGIAAAVGEGRRADAVYTDIGGRSVDLGPASDLDPALLSVALTSDRIEASVVAESFGIVWQDGGERVAPTDRDARFSGIFGRIGWTATLGEDAALRTTASSRWQEPWHSTRNVRPGTYNYMAQQVHRTNLGTELEAHPNERLSVVSGGEVGWLSSQTPPEHSDDYQANWLLGAGWVEASASTAPVSVTAGVRYDASTAFRSAVSPRLVASRAWRRWHYKFGVNQAFRAPGVAHTPFSVLPETTTAFDVELGLGPTAWSYLTVAAFDTRLSHPIVYRYGIDPVFGEFDEYVNGEPVKTTGTNAELQLMSGPFRATVGAGTIWVFGRGPLDWRVDDAPSRAIGVPTTKLVARGTWSPTRRWSFGGVATHLGSRWAVVDRVGGQAAFEEIPAALLLDASVEARHVWVRGLSIGLSVHDLLDSAPPLIQPYRGFHAPLPTGGREGMLRVTVER